MPEQTTGTGQKAPPISGARARAKARSTTQRAAAPSPVRSIEPGHVHYRVAAGVLREIQSRAEAAGITLDVGELTASDVTADANAADPARLQELTAHAVARIGDRFTLLRKFSRHLEGKDKRAGLLSDVIAALVELYRRNPDAMESLGKQAAQNFSAARMQRQAAKETPNTNNNGGVDYATR